MKRIILLSFTLLLGVWNMHAQIYVNGNSVQNGIASSNAFFDASTGFSSASGIDNNTGKGLVIPSVDLTTFEFTDIENGIADGITFPTYFDGMIVYNNTEGPTLTTGNRPFKSVDVKPGFYYFSNPDGEINQNVTGGVWTPLGSATGNDSARGEAIWLPAFNLPWNDDNTVVLTVDLFDRYKKAYNPASYVSGSYYSSTGTVVKVPDHTADVAADFDYVITNYDSDIIEIVGLTASGVLTYKARVATPNSAFMNILLVRKQ